MRRSAGDLRAAIDRLPLATRRRMLEGIQKHPIIVGADGDPRGGVCPVYATSSPPSKRIGRPFARAWDSYAGARLARPASEREVGTLRSMLETSIEQETEPTVFLDAAIAAHKASQARSRADEAVRKTGASARDTRRSAPRRDSGERDRTRELSRRPGWAWLRPFRRYEDYERALQALDEMAREAGSEAEPGQPVPSPSGRG
ncbi:MAG: hypothetical protein M3375_01530 [Actinomycetota bacterium]|nr:hypothetical protein [Actinomycetota bacterium]